MNTRINTLFPIIFVWLWSTGFIGAKYGLPYIEPYFLLVLRFACAIGLLFILARVFKERHLSRREQKGQIFVGVLLHGVYLSGVFFAIKTGISAGIVAIIVGLQPLLTALFSFIWLDKKLKSKQTIGIITGFVGVVLVIVGTNALDNSSINFMGLIACIIGLFGISVGTIIQKKIGQNVPLLSGATYQYIGAIVIVSLLSMNWETQTVEITSSLIFALAWLVFGLSIAALLLLMVVIRAGEIEKVTSYFYLVPPVTVIQTWFLFDEKLSSLSILGCFVSVIGVYFVISTSNQRKT